MDKTKQFIDKCKLNHNEYIDYSLVKYAGSHNIINLICHKLDNEGNEHGLFPQLAYKHLQGQSCPKCAQEINKIKHLSTNVSSFKEKGKSIHNNKYIYDLINEKTYKGIKQIVPIICPNHGIFYQTPDKHINAKEGCPLCKSSHMEEEMRNVLLNNKIDFNEQQRFNWLGKLSLDFYLPEYNIGIECQGIQHFIPIDYTNKGEEWSEQNLKEIIKRDIQKFNLCQENNISLIYYIKDKNLLSKIKENTIYNQDDVFFSLNDLNIITRKY